MAAAAEAPRCVELISVTKRHGPVLAVDHLSLAIRAGELVTLLGPSGCGKTTTLRMVAGLELPSEGQIRIAGEDVTLLPAAARDVSMVFQSYALFPHLCLRDNVAYGLTAAGAPKREARARAEAGLERVGLGGYGDRLPAALSGGQQQRVALARALVLEPRVLLFDEPLSNLDARLRRRMRADIRGLQQSLGFTALYVTHDQEEALAISDRIVLMNEGRIEQEGSPRELYEAPRTAFAARFMGEASVLPAEITAHHGDRAEVRLGELRLELPHRGLAVGPASVAVRPHGVRLGGVGLAARVEEALYLGAHMEYRLSTSAGELVAIDAGVERPHRPGDAVRLELGDHGVALVAP